MNRYQRFGRFSTQLLGVVHADQQRQGQARLNGDRDGVQVVRVESGPSQGLGHDTVDVLLVKVPGHRRDYASKTAANNRDDYTRPRGVKRGQRTPGVFAVANASIRPAPSGRCPRSRSRCRRSWSRCPTRGPRTFWPRADAGTDSGGVDASFSLPGKYNSRPIRDPTDLLVVRHTKRVRFNRVYPTLVTLPAPWEIHA